ncbi:hypothetical protein [Rhizobium sp. Root1220]|uniref:hypothetical protein n=1 Tax=Rhizobium sp. Root1220 TaxID=1736432 RepID=UPI0019107BBD|nr:hypothetical protein [Rhizobium sp. Root1220]
MPLTLLFTIAALIEALTGLALVILPNAVAQLLLGEPLSGAGPAVAPLTGIALFAWGVMAWAGREAPRRSPALVAMLTYNGLATIYLAIVLIDGEFVGPLLLPAVLLHALTATHSEMDVGKRPKAVNGRTANQGCNEWKSSRPQSPFWKFSSAPCS